MVMLTVALAHATHLFVESLSERSVFFEANFTSVTDLTAVTLTFRIDLKTLAILSNLS